MDSSVEKLQELIRVLKESGVAVYSNEGLYIQLYPSTQEPKSVGFSKVPEEKAPDNGNGYKHPSLGIVTFEDISSALPKGPFQK